MEAKLKENIEGSHAYEVNDTDEVILLLTEQLDRCFALLKIARCPNPTCDNAGTITGCVYDSDGDPQPNPEPCQWCYERNDLLNSALYVKNKERG